MQKKVIALAVAGLMSGAALAQSNVTVYGIVDASYMHSSGDDRMTGINSGAWSGSRLGFKGEEALGNGMKAVFVLEYGLTSDVSAGVGAGTPTRQSYVGLAGDFGTVIAGRLQSPGRLTTDKFDPMDSSAAASAVDVMNRGSGTSLRTSTRLSNAAAYVSPKFGGGFTFTGAYSFAGASELDGTAYDDNQERIIGATLDYDNGPLALAYTHHRLNDVGNAQGADAREHLIAGSYDFGVAKLFASYQKNKTTTDLDNKVWQLGTIIPVSAMSDVRLSYAKLNHDTDNMDASSWGVAYLHNMSKRTTLYAAYMRVSNDDASALEVHGNAGAPVTAGDNSRGYTFGIRHKF